MATKYNVFTGNDGDEPVATRAKKAAAVTLGEGLGVSFRVVTDSGSVVHNYTAPVAEAPPSPVEEDPIVGVTPGGEQTIAQQAAATAVEAEELAAETEVQPDAPEPEKPTKKASKAKAKAPKPAPEPYVAPEAPDAEAVEEAIGELKEGKGARKFDTASLKRKIAGLLKKAESTDSQAEAELLTAAAQRLMIRLGIDQAEVEAEGGKAEGIIEESRHFKSVYAKTQVNLIHNVCAGLGDLTVLQSGRWSDATAYIIGHKTDVELALKLVDSLNLQVFSALTAWQKSRPEDRKQQRNYDRLVGSRSFIDGYGIAVRQRLTEARAEETAEASPGAALVLASKQDRVTEKVSELYPKLGKAKGGNGRYSSLAVAAGKAAGKQADLGEKAVADKGSDAGTSALTELL